MYHLSIKLFVELKTRRIEKKKNLQHLDRLEGLTRALNVVTQATGRLRCEQPSGIHLTTICTCKQKVSRLREVMHLSTRDDLEKEWLRSASSRFEKEVAHGRRMTLIQTSRKMTSSLTIPIQRVPFWIHLATTTRSLRTMQTYLMPGRRKRVEAVALITIKSKSFAKAATRSFQAVRKRR